jgi:osmoprotectant transport system substrate-binding protein
VTRWRGLVLAVALCLFFATACSDSSDTQGGSTADDDGIRVASSGFSESELLAEMYAQVIESIGVPVVRLGPVGPREIITPAMELDRIDLVPEYLGAALQYAGAPGHEADTEVARADLNERLASRGLRVLAAAPAQDKDVFVVTAESAEIEGLENISDLARTAAGQRFGGPPECQDRPLCFAGLESVYGLEFAGFVPQRSLAFTAEALHRGEIGVGVMFSTAAELEDVELVELVDDLAMQPAQNVLPLVRGSALERWGSEVALGLDEMSRRLTTTELRSLNLRIDGGESFADVARAWLTEQALVAPA